MSCRPGMGSRLPGVFELGKRQKAVYRMDSAPQCGTAVPLTCRDNSRRSLINKASYRFSAPDPGGASNPGYSAWASPFLDVCPYRFLAGKRVRKEPLSSDPSPHRAAVDPSLRTVKTSENRTVPDPNLAYLFGHNHGSSTHLSKLPPTPTSCNASTHTRIQRGTKAGGNLTVPRTPVRHPSPHNYWLASHLIARGW